MNELMTRLDRRFGRYAIRDLTKKLVICQVVLWIVIMLIEQRVYGFLNLGRYELLHGQIWRLVTFVLLPPMTVSPINLAINLYFLYFIGTSLERHWGSFMYNVYFLLGMLGCVLSTLLVGTYSSSSLLYSIFFAFACLYPNVEVLLFFILPIKVKWLGYGAAALYLFDILTSRVAIRTALILGMLGFLLFFGPYLLKTIQNRQRARQWKDQWR